MASVKTPQSKARSRKDGSAIPLDETDKRLMNLLQSNFPLDPEPFALVAGEDGHDHVNDAALVAKVRELSGERATTSSGPSPT